MNDKLNNQNYQTMRVKKRSTVLLCALFVFAAMLFHTTSRATEIVEENGTILELTELDFMEPLEIPDYNLSIHDNIEIYDKDNNLIAFGEPENMRIKKLMAISDLLTETQRTKLYRLSYE